MSPSKLKNWHSTVRRLLVEGEPILVLGPGVRRIGYDDADSPGWRAVTRRMRLLSEAVAESPAAVAESPAQRFLDAYWRSKLSEEALALESRKREFNTLYSLREPPGDGALLTDPVRIAIAVPLLGTLIDCTRCLGEVIRSGDTPVMGWHSFNDRASPAGASKEAREAREAAAEQLERCAELAQGLWHWSEGSTALGRYGAALSSVGLTADDLAQRDPPSKRAEFTKAMLKVLKIGAIEKSTDYLLNSCLRGVKLPLSGAIIEWLADLLWHVMTSDSAVPPSQSQLAFYVNLRTTEQPRPRVFSRSVPGEYRVSAEDFKSGTPDPSVEVKRRLSRGPNGLESQDDCARVRDRHLDFARTMAATLTAMWDAYVGTAEEMKARRQLPIALSSSYDLSLERQLLEILKQDLAGDRSPEPRDRVFHIVVPVWWTSDDSPERRFDWLLGTYVVRDVAFAADQLTGPNGGCLTWDWYRGDAEKDLRKVLGPVVVKVNGSPMLALGAATSTSLNLGSRPDRAEAHIQLATIFSEHDSVASMITFSDGEAGLPGTILEHLAWDRRSWVFLGDSLPDWIPRLRLLFNARAALTSGAPERALSAEGPAAAEAQESKRAIRARDRGGRARIQRKIAIDRDFDWPEEAMLEALKVQTYKGDLGWLADYARSYDRDSESDIAWFLDAVRRRQW